MWRGRRALFPEMNLAIDDQRLAYPSDSRSCARNMLIGLFASSRLARGAFLPGHLFSTKSHGTARIVGAVELLDRITFERDESHWRPPGLHIRRIVSDSF
jgi:hypothetical protein